MSIRVTAIGSRPPVGRARTVALSTLSVLVAVVASLAAGVAPAFAVSPLSVNPNPIAFGPRAVGVASPDVQVFVQNTSGGPVTVNSVTISSPAFHVSGSNCSGVLGAGASCVVRVFFRPQTAAAASGVLTIAMAAGTSTASVNGLGTLAPPISAFDNFQGSSPCGNGQGPPAVGVASANGSLWYTSGSSIEQVDPATGLVTGTPTNLSGGKCAFEITAAAGNLWFTEDTHVGRMSASSPGTITDFLLPNPASPGARRGIAVDGAGIVWITQDAANKVVRLDPAGNAGAGSYVSYAMLTANASPADLAIDGSGNVWITEPAAGKIAELVPGTGNITEFVVPTPSGPSQPQGIAIDAGNNIWITDQGPNQVDRYAPGGATWTQYGLGTAESRPQGLTVLPGPTGFERVFFTQLGQDKISILKVNTSTLAGTLSEHSVPPPSVTNRNIGPYGITLGPDGNVWVNAESSGFFEYHVVSTIAAVPTFIPPAVNFGQQPAATYSDPRRVDLSNTGSADLHVGKLAIGGTDAADFGLRSNNCINVVVPAPPNSGPCQVWVLFHPLAAATTYNAVLDIWTDFQTAPLTVSLTGAGTGAGPATYPHPLPTSGAAPTNIAADGSGRLWFTEVYQGQIGEMIPGATPSSPPTIAEFTVPSVNPTPGCDVQLSQGKGGKGGQANLCSLGGITLGSDGNMWFTEGNGNLGQVTPAGVVSEFDAHLNAAGAITSGPNGHLYIADCCEVQEYNMQGQQVNLFNLPTPQYFVTSLTSGPNADIWFTESPQPGSPPGPDKVGQLDPTTGTVTEFSVPGGAAGNLVSGGGAVLWFTETTTDTIGEVTSTGLATATIAEFLVPTTDSLPRGIVASGGFVYFTEAATNRVGKFAPGNFAALVEISLKHRAGIPVGIAASGTGLWVTQEQGDELISF